MAKTFGISEIAGYLADHFGLNKKQSVSCTKAVLAYIKIGVSKGDTFRAVGFGTFKLVVRKAREGRNPLTGAQIKIAAKKVIRFKATKGTIGMPADYRPKPVVVKIESAPKKTTPKKAAPKKAAPKKATPKKGRK